MSPPIETETERQAREFRELCFHMGLTLAVWQRLEDEHFRLFVKMLGAPRREICSIVYHSTESFDSRRIMVDRMARLFFGSELDKSQAKEANREWNDLAKLLKEASGNRNKIAHYSVEYDVHEVEREGRVTFDLGSARLRPSPHNVVSKLLGWTADKPEHNLSPSELTVFRNEFDALAQRIVKLNRTLPLPKRQFGEELIRLFGHDPDQLEEWLSRSTPQPKDDPPSDQ